MYSKSLKRSYSKMTKNSMLGSTSTIPTFSSHRSEDGAMTISHKEYICDIQGSTSFTLQNYLINPGNATLFPWLAQIAQNYDEYKFHGLIFHYRSTSTDNTSTNSQIGTLIMAANYNPAAPNFVNKQQMMEYAGAASVKVSNDLQFGIECDSRKNGGTAIEYVAPNGTAPVGEDSKTYHLANLQIATNQTQTTGQIGELWCTYKITLRKPKYCVTNALCQPYLEHYNAPGASFSCPTITSATPYGYASTTAITGGQPFLNLTSVQKLSTSQGGSIITNGYVTNITGGNSGLFNFAVATPVSGGSTNTYGFGFRFPDTLGSGTYSFQLFINGLNNATSQIVLSNSIWTAIQSSNVTIYGLKTSIDQGPLTADSGTDANPRTIMVSFRATLQSSAFASALAAPHITKGTYVSVPNGTYAGLALTDVAASSTFTPTTSCSLLINQINPSVIN